MASAYGSGRTIVGPPEPPPVSVGDVGALIDRIAPRYGIDPAAARAVARGEGGLVNRANDIGDLSGGGSYGPFQLYAQGALPPQYRGNRRAADAWAWSPAGIEYAIRKMAESGAKGLTGRAAVETIIRRFERPADPDTSVQNALGRLGTPAAPSGPVAPAQAAGSYAPQPHATGSPRALLAALMDSNNELLGVETPPLLLARLQAPTASPVASGNVPTAAPTTSSGPRRSGNLTSLQLLGQPHGLSFAPVDHGRFIGFPGQGTHSVGEGPDNWQSDHAWDIGVPVGTPVYATRDGVIGNRIGSLGSSSSRFAGLRVYVEGGGHESYYAHLSRLTVKAGQHVRAGQLIGYSGSANGVAHVHYAER